MLHMDTYGSEEGAPGRESRQFDFDIFDGCERVGAAVGKRRPNKKVVRLIGAPEAS